MKQNEIAIGNRYTAKISNKLVAVCVKEINEVNFLTGRTRKRFECFNENTGRMITIKSAAKFRARLGTPVNEIWK